MSFWNLISKTISKRPCQCRKQFKILMEEHSVKWNIVNENIVSNIRLLEEKASKHFLRERFTISQKLNGSIAHRYCKCIFQLYTVTNSNIWHNKAGINSWYYSVNRGGWMIPIFMNGVLWQIDINTELCALNAWTFWRSAHWLQYATVLPVIK